MAAVVPMSSAATQRKKRRDTVFAKACLRGLVPSVAYDDHGRERIRLSAGSWISAELTVEQAEALLDADEREVIAHGEWPGRIIER